MLAAAGLDETALQTPPDYPVDDVEKLACGRRRHASLPAGHELLRQARRDAGHLRGQRLAAPTPTPTRTTPCSRPCCATVERLAGEPVTATGVDGCGAPLFALTLAGLARAFVAHRHGRAGHAGAPGGRGDPRHIPTWLGGTRRDVTALIAGVPGLIAKDGAEGVYAAALPDGRAVAFKVDDGGQRARPPIMVAALRALGVDAPVLDELADVPLLGGGRPVGEVRAAF